MVEMSDLQVHLEVMPAVSSMQSMTCGVLRELAMLGGTTPCGTGPVCLARSLLKSAFFVVKTFALFSTAPAHWRVTVHGLCREPAVGPPRPEDSQVQRFTLCPSCLLAEDFLDEELCQLRCL